MKLLLEAAKRCESRGPDAKAEALLDWIYRLQAEEGDPDLKVLVFTEFVPTQQMLMRFLTERGFEVVCLNGSMDMEERKRVQDAFAKDLSASDLPPARSAQAGAQACAGAARRQRYEGVRSSSCVRGLASVDHHAGDSFIAWLGEAFLHAYPNGSVALRTVLDSTSLFPFRLSPISADYLVAVSGRLDVLRHGLDQDLIMLRTESLPAVKGGGS